MYSTLEFVCQRSNNTLVSKFLKNNTTSDSFVDVLYKNGLYFNIAISHDNPSLLKILIDYMYDTKQINIDPKDNSTDQSIRYNHLQQIIKDSKKEYIISEEIDSILASFCKEYDSNDSYIDYDNLSTHDQEYHDLDLTGNTKVLEDSF